MKILRKINGTTSEILHRHLIEARWKSVNPQNIFFKFLNDTVNMFTVGN